MINRRGEVVLPPVQWVQHDVDDMADLAAEFAEFDEEFGSQWILGFQLADSYLLEDLYRRLEHQPDIEVQHQFAVGTVAAHYILQKATIFLMPVIPREAVVRALHYLTAPSPGLENTRGSM